MTIMDLKKQIRARQLGHLYILYGEEFTILDEYIRMISEQFKQVMNCESITDIYPTLTANSLLYNPKDCLYVIRNDKEFQSNQKYWKNLEKLLQRKGCTVLFKYPSLQKNTQFYKRFEGCVVLFDKLSPDIIKKYIKQLIDVPDNFCDYLIEVCGCDYGRIKLEIDKVTNLAQYDNISVEKAFRSVVESGLIHQEVSGEASDLVNCIMERNIRDLSYYMEQSIVRGDNPIFILSMIHNTAKALLQMELLGSKKNIGELTGLNGFQIANAQKFLGKFTENELVRILKLVKYCDTGIKNGLMPSELAIPYLIVHIV